MYGVPTGIRTYRDKESGQRVEAVQINHVDMCYQAVEWIEKVNGRGAAITTIAPNSHVPNGEEVDGVLIGTGLFGEKPRKLVLAKQMYLVKHQNNEFYPVAESRFEDQYELEGE